MATVTETFNTADSDTLGPVATWTEDLGDFDVVSNKCQLVTAAAVAWVGNLTTVDHEVSVKVESSAITAPNSNAEGVIARKATSALQTYYLFDAWFQQNVVRSFRVAAGAYTAIGTNQAHTLNAATQYTVKLAIAGNAIETSVDGTVKQRISDTGITTGTGVGMRGDYEAGHSGTVHFDDFTASDLTVVSHRASQAGSGNTTTSVGIVIPASTVANDIVIAAFTNGGSSADATVADNEGAGTWAKILSGDDGNTNLSVWWKRASANTAGKTVTASSMTNSCTGVVSVYSGCLTSGNPYGGQTFQSNASGTESHAAITPTVNGSMVFLVVGQQPDIAISTQAATSPAVLLERAEHLSTGGLDCSVALASEVQVTAGTTGALTWAQTNAATMSIAFYLTPASLSLSATVNQITETDLAQAIARLKAKAIGQNTETGLSQTVTRVKSKTLGQNTETDLAQTIAWAPRHRLVNQVIESDLSQAVARLKAKAIGQTLETDFAQEITRDTSVIVAVAQATETDLSQAIARLKTKAVNQALETDLAQVLAGVKTRSIAQTAETDLAQALIHSKLKAVGQITETDLAQSVLHLKRLLLGQASETDAAQALSHLKAKLLGQVTEMDLAQAIAVSGLKLINVAQVSETDLAQALLWNPKIRIVSQITETDLAQAIVRLKAKGINQITEADLAQTLTHLKTLAVNQIVETDLAQALTHAKLKAVGQITETDLAQAVARLKTRSVAQTLETDLAQAISRLKAKAIGQTVETDLAQAVTVPGRLIVAVNQTTESDLAQAINWAPKIRSLGIAAEIDLAQFITGLKTSAIGMVSETSLAQSLTAAKAKEIAQALETDLAQSVAWSPKSRLLAQVFETDLAQIILYIPSQTVGNVWRFEAVVIGTSKIISATIEGPVLNGAVLATSKLINAEMAEVSDLAEATITASKLTDAEFQE
jgi:hypothetical protein